MNLLNSDELFQTLLMEVGDPHGIAVAADLEVSSLDHIPFLTHSSTVAQDRNSNGLWSVTLSLSLFAEPSEVFEKASAVYSGVKAWGELPMAGVLPDVGGVEQVEDLSAFSRLSGAVQMENKFVVQYVGSWNLLVRGA